MFHGYCSIEIVNLITMFSTKNFIIKIFIVFWIKLKIYFCPRIKCRMPHFIYLSWFLSSLQSIIVSHLSLFFIILSLLKTIGQLFCTRSLNLALSAAFLRVHWGNMLRGRISQRQCPSQHIKGYRIWYIHRIYQWWC